MSRTNTESTASHPYFDREFGLSAIQVLPGQCYVTGGNMLLTTVLGSCISACLCDRTAGVGGMNHFMLPENLDQAGAKDASAMRYGAHAMGMLLDELRKAGAQRERLEAKVFGGGAVLAGMTALNIGDLNAEFVIRYLRTAQVKVIAQDLRGSLPRRVNYFPQSGKVAVRKLRRHDDTLRVQRIEQALVRALATRPVEDNPIACFDTNLPANDPRGRIRRTP